MVTVYFDAHARTSYNESDRIAGHFDVELSDYGRRQAADEKTIRYAEIPLDVVFSSDLKRCVQTVEIMFKHQSIPIIKDQRLRECDYGAFTGKSRAELLDVADDRIIEPFRDGESYSQVLARLRSFLLELLVDHCGKSVLLMAHGSLFWGLEHLVGGVPIREAMKMSPVENLGKRYLVTNQALGLTAEANGIG